MRFAERTFQTADSAQTIVGQEVTPQYFSTLGVRPQLGVAFGDNDPNAVVVSWQFWQRWLSGDPNALGRTLTFDGTSRTVVGVMPQSFFALDDPNVEVLTPLDLRPLLADTARARRTVSGFARLTPGTTPEQARAYMATFTTTQREQYAAIHGRERWSATPLRESLVGPVRLPLLAQQPRPGC